MTSIDHPAPPWPASPWALQIQRWASPAEDAPASLLVAHPTDPVRAELADVNDETLRSFAQAYLVKLLALEPLAAFGGDDLKAWVAALDSKAGTAWFGWMPITAAAPSADGARTAAEPAGSNRQEAEDGGEVVVLFASQRMTTDLFLGSGFGLRVVLRLRRIGERHEVAALSFAASLPFGPWKGLVGKPADQALELFGGERQWNSAETAEAAALAGVREDSLRLRGLRLGRAPDGELRVERRFTGRAVADDPEATGEDEDALQRDRPSWFLTFRGGRENIGTLVHREPVYAGLGPGDARVFAQDPASHGGSGARREEGPRRDADVLDRHRITESIAPTRQSALADPLQPFVAVQPCRRFVPGDAAFAQGVARPIHLPGDGGPAVRSHDASAVQAFRHLRAMLRRMRAYGIDLDHYFWLVQPTIEVFYRSGISPGPGKDGQAVNARVMPGPWSTNFYLSFRRTDQPKVRIHLGIADRARRERRRREPDDPPSRAVPLGIAADPRWMWHEFSHVLLLAATHEIELRFAHSPGDALAAIASDPDSRLAEGRSRWRFVSFPWVMLSRRHDRSVRRGWGWNGHLRAAVAALPDHAHPRHKGYASEQILSSTLFRLYRCLGGDTEAPGSGPDRIRRRGASHYSLYLVMQAIRLLGDARVVPATRPEAFAQALVEADVAASSPWEIFDPVELPLTHRRVPGCAHKLVRWAFEAQGLYTAPGGDVDAPGAPLPVDVWIADARPDREEDAQDDVVHAPGHYLPVSLHWQHPQDPPGTPMPAWQAGAQALRVQADGSLEVEVGNRGGEPALGVRVRAWWAPWPQGSVAPDWNPGAWTAFSGDAGARDIPAGGSIRFAGLTHAAPAVRYLVLVAAGCEADRSNLDTATGLACSVHPTPLVDLVAGDNNLALRVVG